ncbi:carbon-nitrogen hydrolase family protein [Massilia sp. BJB1822]|uniref:carbon-nitrogen hydrolase family protein n=1 Tax=Massilia sp. BJB1822 TaxID=2744470 RepID=UPI0015939798|nr:carbon-nitrogen hydrolase family protein [Massilia sp. BJB1822]NVD98788.1 carbon-nitrogen hydrolase family protein [Massilia sp. BJB1822]
MNRIRNIFSGPAVKVAVIQLCILHNQTEKNLEAAVKLIREAAGTGANIVCLPATFATGINFPSLKRDAQAADGPIVSTLRTLAASLGIALVFGLLERDGNDIYDAAFYIDESGAIAGSYRRNSIWEGERAYISRGTPAPLIETRHGKIGLLVSYDVRFPEASRRYFAENADIIICVASLFHIYGFAVESLCRARAADNACYFVFASCIGENGFAMLEYMGGSLIADGTVMKVDQNRELDVLAHAGQQQEIVQAELLIGRKKKIGKELPYQADYVANWQPPLRGQLQA